MNWLKIRRLPIFLFFIFLVSSLLVNINKAQAQDLKGKIILVFRNDDPSALSNAEHEKRVMEVFRKYNIPQTISIIPFVTEDYYDGACTKFHLLSENQEMLNLLRKWHEEGLIEIALHGYTHQTNPFYSKPLFYLPVIHKGYSEFRGLPYKEQLQRIIRGKNLLENWFDVPVITFIAPWDTYDKNTICTAKKAGMRIFSGNLNMYNDPSIVKKYKELLFIQHTINIDNLDKFKPALARARKFIKKNKKDILIVALYHSWTLKPPDDFRLLEEIVKEVSQSEDITIITIKQLYAQFSQILNEIFLQKLESKMCILKTVKLFPFLKQKCQLSFNSFDVLDGDYYARRKKQAISLNQRLYMSVAILASFLSILYLWIRRRGYIKKKLALALFICIIFFWTYLFVIGYFACR